METKKNLNRVLSYLKENSEIPKIEIQSKVEEQPKVNVEKEINDLRSSVHSAYSGTRQIKKSKGFDVEKFEFLMRSKLIDEYKRMQSFDRPYISVTELLSCLRKNYYERKKYEIDLDSLFTFPYLAIMQEVGTFIHKYIQTMYSFNESEKPVISEKYKVKGRVDSINEEYLLEFKTIDPSKFKWNYSEADYHQAIIYSYILNDEYSYKIKFVTLVYILRNLKNIVPFDIDVDFKLAKSFLEKSIILRKCMDDNIVADPIGSSEEQCKYCLYKKYCQKDKSKVKKLVSDDKNLQGERPVFLL